MNNLLGQNIAKFRKRMKFAQEDLARKLKISFQAVSKWETGQSLPDCHSSGTAYQHYINRLIAKKGGLKARFQRIFHGRKVF